MQAPAAAERGNRTSRFKVLGGGRKAVVELLTEKGVLTGEEVKEQVKKLKAETTLNIRRPQ